MSKSAYLGLFSLLVLMVVVSLVFHKIWTAPPPEDSIAPDEDRSAAYTGGFTRRPADLNVQSSSPPRNNTGGSTAEIERGGGIVVTAQDPSPVEDRVERNASRPRVAAARLSLADYKTYVVKKGDTLWKIAEKHLGHGGKWRELYELNHGLGLIKNERDLRPNKVIALYKQRGNRN